MNLPHKLSSLILQLFRFPRKTEGGSHSSGKSGRTAQPGLLAEIKCRIRVQGISKSFQGGVFVGLETVAMRVKIGVAVKSQFDVLAQATENLLIERDRFPNHSVVRLSLRLSQLRAVHLDR